MKMMAEDKRQHTTTSQSWVSLDEASLSLDSIRGLWRYTLASGESRRMSRWYPGVPEPTDLFDADGIIDGVECRSITVEHHPLMREQVVAAHCRCMAISACEMDELEKNYE